ncbi:MAG: AAA family ATPase, partial [Verrucomicrobiota bacterium]
THSVAMGNGDDPPPPTPEEISRKLAEFVKANFPGTNAFTHFPGAPPQPEESEEVPDHFTPSDVFDFNLRPRDIKAHLDRYVIQQHDAKKALSIAVCDHYNHAKFLRRLQEDDPEQARQIEIAKQNVVILGPTGVGKTYLVKHVAELIGVPFVKADATKFSETGYVGADVDDLVRELVQKADGDVGLAEYGIIYIDEVDKLATRGDMIGRDVSGRGVQTTLLKLMEDTEVPLRNPMDIPGQMQAMMDFQSGRRGGEVVNTRHILFIVSGAFSGLQGVIANRLRDGSIGFGAEQKDVPQSAQLVKQVSTQDLIDYGFEAEFVGRLPVRVVCEPLEAEDLFSILRDSEGSLIRQYERDFEAYGIHAEFDESALQAIAERAVREETGARGLVTVCESILREFKFELPGTNAERLLVDRALVEDPRAALEQYRQSAEDLVDQRVFSEIALFVREFREKHGVNLDFSAPAVQAIETICLRDHTSALQVCKRLFRDFQFGLSLIQKNTGQDTFEIPDTAVDDPDKFLSDLVVRCYRDSQHQA